jgi:hypothetical protein
MGMKMSDRQLSELVSRMGVALYALSWDIKQRNSGR